MKNSVVLFAIFLTCSIAASAQDVIIFRNGNEMQAKVSEVGTSEIKYQRFDNLSGPVYTINKKDVFMIKYENGTKDIITDLSSTNTSGDKKVMGTDYRSPGLAFLFSFLLPGGGQYYNHQHAKGGAMTGLWVGGLITTAVAASANVDCYETYNGNFACDYRENDGAQAAGAVGGMVMFGSWLWSVIDAPVNAARINRNNKATGLLEFQKEDKFSLRIEPFRSQGLGGSLSMRF
ncbi:MAG: hypothetical protein SH857_00885 [Chitinophagales bacterium]|nr:hypothetical protein [Chitinophagales bacterium]